MGIEFDFLPSRLPEGILRLALTEDPTGDPVLVPAPGGAYRTSANLVHHLHHLERLAAATGVRPERFDTVVKWGGGYGSQARLFRKLHGGAPTYVIVDTPLFSALVPLGLVPRLRLRGELFVSMWALNESSRAAQDHVVERRWFGADRLLMGMHAGEPLIGRAIADVARLEPVGDFLPGQRYLFR